MIKYAIRKFSEYYFFEINKELEKEALIYLNENEKNIYYSMDYYDRFHGLSVYSKLKNKNLDNIYLKLALLHDCGKNRASFFIRVLHKFGFNTKIKNHAYMGYIKLKDIDINLANLIKVHHDKLDDEYIKIFQDADDRS